MPKGEMQTDDQYFAILAGAGVSVFVSSGDGGSSPGLNGYGDNTGPVQVESPASDPNVTAVGGTSLFLKVSTGVVSSESAWSLGGGGSSQQFARPRWQNGAGVPAGANRLVPDVALVADLNTGGYLIFNGQLYVVGGTSWSAPAWAAICARINQVRYNTATPPLGLLGPKTYPLLGSSSFRDITAGSNGPNGVYNAGPGFDLCTGIGVPVIDSLIKTLGGGLQITVKGVDKDFTGDGYADLVWENTFNGERLIWLLQNGVYSSTISLPSVSPTWHIAGVGDFLGNGQSDLVWENTVTRRHVIWILNDGVPQYDIELPAVSAPQHIDVMYVRMDEDMLLSSTGYDGAPLRPGLLDAITDGKLTIANAPGNGVGDDKAIYAYVPCVSSTTSARHRCWPTCRPGSVPRAQLDYVLAPRRAGGQAGRRLGGSGVLIGPGRDRGAVEATAANCEPARPLDRAGTVALSTHPTFDGAGMYPTTSTCARSCTALRAVGPVPRSRAGRADPGRSRGTRIVNSSRAAAARTPGC